MSATQWMLDPTGSYVGAGETVASLPPGLYDLAVSQGVLYWMPAQARTDDLIRFPDSRCDEVVAEIEKFWDQEVAFTSHSLPFKRGILLYGPPGSGKSCTLQLLSRDVVERGGVIMVFSSLFLTGYRQLRSIQPDIPIVVLMEDLDEILKKSSDESGILNMLDGIEALSKVVFLATTNYPERLGPRVINRPSRFDRRFKIPHPNAESRRLYLDTIKLPGDDLDVDRIIRDTEGMSLAHLKELFVSTFILDTPYEQVLKELKGMPKKVSSDTDEEFDELEGAVRKLLAGYV